MHLRNCLAVLGVLAGMAGAAERPTAEAIRAAAAAARDAVVTVEADGAMPQDFLRLQPDMPFIVPQPEQPDGRQWRFEFQWPPQDGQQPDNEDLQRFFRDFNRGRIVQAGRRTCQGVVVRVGDGRALVAAPHSVVGRAQRVHVTTQDGRELKTKRLGTDGVSGLTCLEVKDEKLKAIAAAAEPAQAGDWVLAVGGAETGGAISIGIVSATNRPGQGGGRVLLTDALVPGGMAGAPLVNLKGQMVGIALPPDRGRGFTQAAPAATVTKTIDALARDGRVRRGFVGLMIAPLGPDIRQQLQIDHGIQAEKVMAGHAAQKAGIQDGDILLELDGKKIADPGAFIAMVGGKQPGETVTLKIMRGGDVRDVQVTLGERPENPGVALDRLPRPHEGEKLDIGVSVTPVTPELAAIHKLGNDKGLVVTHVAANGPAEKARPKPIRPGEMIGEVGKKPVTTVDEAKAAIAEARKKNEKTLLLLVRSSEGTRYVVIDLKPQAAKD